jgi:hypothetical protein
LFAALYLFVYYVRALGNSMPVSLFKEFQEQIFEDPEIFFSGQTRQVSLNNIVPIMQFVETA